MIAKSEPPTDGIANVRNRTLISPGGADPDA
jgi:hypothetical protein